MAQPLSLPEEQDMPHTRQGAALAAALLAGAVALLLRFLRRAERHVNFFAVVVLALWGVVNLRLGVAVQPLARRLLVARRLGGTLVLLPLLLMHLRRLAFVRALLLDALRGLVGGGALALLLMHLRRLPLVRALLLDSLRGLVGSGVRGVLLRGESAAAQKKHTEEGGT